MRKGNTLLYWAKVVSLGLILGFGLQFAQAWTVPTQAPPGGNVSGPMTTGNGTQYKTGRLGVNSNVVPVNAFEVGGGGDALIGGNAYVNGNVGVGTIAPTQKLDVNGNVKGTGFCIGASCINSWPSGGGSGTVTNIATGVGLTGGPITTTGTLAVDTNTIATKAYVDSRTSLHYCYYGGKQYSTGAVCKVVTLDRCLIENKYYYDTFACQATGSWSVITSVSNSSCPIPTDTSFCGN
jgi:hypothetical protein